MPRQPDIETIAVMRGLALLFEERMELTRFMNAMYQVIRKDYGTNPTQWQVVIQFGPVKMYQPLEGGRTSLRPLNHRATITYRVRPWFRALIRALHGRYLGRWAGRG